MIFVPQTPEFVDGVKLHRQVVKLVPRHRALIALDLESGSLRLASLTRRQAAAIAKVSLSTVARERHPQPPPTDAAIERVIKRLGCDRVMAALDRLTTPTMQAAE